MKNLADVIINSIETKNQKLDIVGAFFMISISDGDLVSRILKGLV
mgnify:CR=1 FL=1